MAVTKYSPIEDSHSVLQKDDGSKQQATAHEMELLPARTAPRSMDSTWHHRFHKYWLYEALSSTFSIAIFIAIIILLSRFEGREYGTANSVRETTMKRPEIYTYLSLMSAFMRAAMILPVATAISQLTWSWFKSHRRLIDIERFDEASRGMIGAIGILWTVRFRHLVVVGAAIIILALPTDAFIQSSVMIPLRRQINCKVYTASSKNITDVTTLPKATSYYESQVWDSNVTMYATTPMIDSILLGIVYTLTARSLSTSNDPGQCPSGYCDFGTFQTLGIVPVCADRSKDIVQIGQNLTLPGSDGLTLRNNTEENFFAVKSYLTLGNMSEKSNIGPLISRTAMIINVWEQEPPLAMECFLYWAVYTMTARADDTTSFAVLESLEEDNFANIETRFEEGKNVDEPSMAYKLWPGKKCWANNQTLGEQDDSKLYEKECVYRIGLDAHSGVQRWIMNDQEGFKGVCEFRGTDNITNESKWTRMNTYLNNIYEFLDTKNRNGTSDQIRTMHENIALFMTRNVRSEGGMLNATYDLLPGEINGTMYEMVFYYKIAWARLIYPAIMISGSALFVIATALTTKRDFQWRRSNIPMLFHGLGEQERDICRFETDLVKMEHAAYGMDVRLANGGEGVRLTGDRDTKDAKDLKARQGHSVEIY